MHYYQFNIGDYRRKTGHLTLTEHAIYRAMIDTYYLTEQPLCDDHAKLMRSHSVRTEEEVLAFENVLSDFFEKTPEGYRHGACDDSLGKIYAKSEKAKKSAEARWKKKDKNKGKEEESCDEHANASKNNANASEAHANGMRTVCERYADDMLPNNPLPNNPITQYPVSSKTLVPSGDETATPPAVAPKKSAKPKVDFSIFGMTDEMISEVKRIRRQNKGGAITQRVANALAKEFHMAATCSGYTFDELLTEWETRGWKSFKAEWVTQKPGSQISGFSKITQQNIKNLEGDW